jgi:hypothetical protein
LKAGLPEMVKRGTFDWIPEPISIDCRDAKRVFYLLWGEPGLRRGWCVCVDFAAFFFQAGRFALAGRCVVAARVWW